MFTVHRCPLVVGFILCSMLCSVQAADANLSAGKAKAAMCGACHGAAGISNLAEYPNLAGQKPQYLVNALKAYRDGSRNNQIMVPMADGLSDQDIQDLAAYFASLPGAAGQPAQSGN